MKKWILIPILLSFLGCIDPKVIPTSIDYPAGDGEFRDTNQVPIDIGP